MMKALILSCSTGGGHNAAGLAIKEQIEREGGEAYFFDYLTLAGGNVSRIVSNAYVELVKHAPCLFGLVYLLGDLVSRLTTKSPVYHVNSRMSGYLEQFLNQHDFDVIFMPHLYPAETITAMKNQGKVLPLTIAVATDYTSIPFWGETKCDYYMIPDTSLSDTFTRQNIRREQLAVTGIPVSPVFSDIRNMDRQTAREKLGLHTDNPIHLIIGGSMGAGNIKKLTAEILRKKSKKERIIVITGSNKKLCSALKKAFRAERSIAVLGHTDRMPLFMKACDVIYTKPGGLTSTEAAVSQTPLVHTLPIPGCETLNRAFFLKRGMSASGKNAAAQADAGARFIVSETARSRIKQAQARHIDGQAAKRIYDFAENMLSSANN